MTVRPIAKIVHVGAVYNDDASFELVMSSRITADYLIETPYAVEDAAAAMAANQSTGTYLRVPGETDALREQFAARVELAETIETRSTPSLPGVV